MLLTNLIERLDERGSIVTPIVFGPAEIALIVCVQVLRLSYLPS
jgi:hypothetical protein